MATTLYHCSVCKYVFPSIEDVTSGHICRLNAAETDRDIVEAGDVDGLPKEASNFKRVPLTIVKTTEDPVASSPSTLKWSSEESHLMLDKYISELRKPFNERENKLNIWESVAAAVARFSITQCENRFFNIKITWKKLKKAAASSEEDIYYEYAEKMEVIHQIELAETEQESQGEPQQQAEEVIKENEMDTSELVDDDDLKLPAIRWTKSLTHQLLDYYEEAQIRSPKGGMMSTAMWEDIASNMPGLTVTQCRNRIRSLSNTYNNHKMAAARGETCQYEYEERLDNLFAAIMMRDEGRKRTKSNHYKGNSQWTDELTHRLLDLYEIQCKLIDCGQAQRHRIWNTISQQLPPFKAEQCRGRMKTLTNTYNRYRLCPAGPKYQYEDRLDTLFGNTPRDVPAPEAKAKTRVGPRYWTQEAIEQLLDHCEKEYDDVNPTSLADGTFWQKVAVGMKFSADQCRKQFATLIDGQTSGRGRKRRSLHADRLDKLRDIWPDGSASLLEDEEAGAELPYGDVSCSEARESGDGDISVDIYTRDVSEGGSDDEYVPEDEDVADVQSPRKRPRKSTASATPPAKTRPVAKKEVVNGAEPVEGVAGVMTYLKGMEKRQLARHQEQLELMKKHQQEQMALLNKILKPDQKNKILKQPDQKNKKKTR